MSNKHKLPWLPKPACTANGGMGTIIVYYTAEQMCEYALTAVHDVLAAPQGEPAAWGVAPRYEDSDGFFDFTDSRTVAETLAQRGYTVTPLYTYPAPLAEPQGWQEHQQQMVDMVESRDAEIVRLHELLREVKETLRDEDGISYNALDALIAKLDAAIREQYE